MWYLITIFLGFLGGALCVFLALDAKRRKLDAVKRKQTANAKKLLDTLEEIKEREQQGLEALRTKQQQAVARLKAEHATRVEAFEREFAQRIAELETNERQSAEAIVAKQAELDQSAKAIAARHEELEQIAARMRSQHSIRLQEVETELQATKRQDAEAIAARHADLEQTAANMKSQHAVELQAIEAKQEQVNALATRLTAEHAARQQELEREFKARIISYDELQAENAILKQDLSNLDVGMQKHRLDGEQQRLVQETQDQLATDLGSRYLKENVKWISDALTPNNFANCKKRLQDVIERCRGIGLAISAEEESTLLGELKAEYEMVVRAALQREEQARIKARIREEQALEREVERELKQLEREREAIQVALEKALADTKDEHSAEVESLKARLAEAEAKAQRTKSQAELTKSGHIYVISNIGSFGEGIYKIGMTRRLEPIDRIKELGDASVPFPFDIHMMISSNDAPTLENAIHRMLHKMRINKANPRKEFFKTEISAIIDIVNSHHGEVQYLADAEALEYRQSIDMSEDDGEYIDSVYDRIEDDGETEDVEA